MRATWRRVSSAEIRETLTWSAAWFLAAHCAAARNWYDRVALKADCTRGWVMLPAKPRAASRIMVPAPP